MEKRYVIKWEIDEFASSPLEAIKKAIQAMPVEANEDTLATVFDVEELDENGKTVNKFQIDVLEVNPFDSDDVEEFNEKDHTLLEYNPMTNNKSDEVIEPELRKALLKSGFKENNLNTVKELIGKLKHVLPINLEERGEVFELENGGELILLSETDCTYRIVRDLEEIDCEYEQLEESDLGEIARILEDVHAENEKAFERSQS